MLEAGFAAMRELLSAEADPLESEAAPATEPRPPREVSLRAPDRAALLADWLAELAFLAETEGFVPDRLASLELEESSLRARVEGHSGEPPPLVKGVTYHRLALERVGEGWRATVVLDV